MKPKTLGFSRLIQRISRRSGVLTFREANDRLEDNNFPSRFTWAREIAEPVQGKKILDVGCWTGKLLKSLEGREPAELLGVDLEGPWIQIAVGEVHSAKFLQVSSVEDLSDFNVGEFDVIFFLETLEHVPRASQTGVLKTLALTLSSSGKIVLSTPIAGLAALLDPAWFLVGHRHYRLVTLRTLVESAGLKVESVSYSGNIWTTVNTNLLYFWKHVLRRNYVPSKFVSSREPSRLYSKKRFDSTNIWLELRTLDSD